jgi:hypothetical protein
VTARPIYGYVYELILRGQTDIEHSYVGMTTTTIHRRVHGSAGHTSPGDVAKDPWKAGILPGRAGYRCLEIVRVTGDPAEDDRALRRAEAFWIDRLRPVHNDVRPVRPPGEIRRKPTSADGSRRVAPRSNRSPAPSRRRKPIRARAVLCALIVAVSIALVARFVVLMQLPWPAAPWIAAPVLGGAFGWASFWRIHRAWRRLTR